MSRVVVVGVIAAFQRRCIQRNASTLFLMVRTTTIPEARRDFGFTANSLRSKSARTPRDRGVVFHVINIEWWSRVVVGSRWVARVVMF